MRIYLVGGAVRDSLLGLPLKEKDWVVVGGTKETLLKRGFIQVGRDFPVFLHPETKEEYALARTERKIGSGYYGFDCDARSSVTLEQDLERRDLTINAMAMDEKGNIIDPYHGRKDLEAKILRHVSHAFVEDPVRVLRVARFAARYHHLGFTLAEETKALIYEMVQAGELENLIPERIWQECYRSLCGQNPEVFVRILRNTGALSIIIPEIDALFGVPNPPCYHPEIDSGIHSVRTLEKAATLSHDPAVRFAALVHDLGKAKTAMVEWPKHYGHEKSGLEPIEQLCNRLTVPKDFKQLALLACRLHLLVHQLFSLRAHTIIKVLEQADAFRRPDLFKKVLLVCEADALGSKPLLDYPEGAAWLLILSACAKITAQEIMEQGVVGAAIKEKLHEKRVLLVKQMRQAWEAYNDK